MPLPVKETIKIRRLKKLYELFIMKNYMSVQSEVLQNLSRHFGNNETYNMNSFLSSPIGQFCMKAYRDILIDKYGRDTSKPNSMNPNTDTDAGFFGLDQKAREDLVNSITNDIVIKYNKEGRDV